MKYEKPKVLQEEHVEVQQLVAGCGMLDNENITCDADPNATASG